MKPAFITCCLVLTLLAAHASQDDIGGIKEWKRFWYAEKTITLDINGNKKKAKIKAARFDVSFKGHGLSTCVGDKLTTFYDRTSIPVLFPESEFKGQIVASSSGHVHVQTEDAPGKDTAMVVSDKFNTVAFSGDATIGANIYFVEQARGYALEELGQNGQAKSLGQVVFPPNVVRFAVKEPDMPFSDSDLFQATAISDFDFQLQLHLSEQLTTELNALDGAPSVEILAGSQRLVPRMTAILKGVSRTSLLMIVPFPKDDSEKLTISVDRFKASVDLPGRIRTKVPREAVNKTADITFEAPGGQRPQLAYGLLTKPKDAKLERGKQQGSWKVPVPSDSYAIIRSRPRDRLRTLEFVQADAQDISLALPAVNPAHPMHAILTSDKWKQGFAAVGAPIPMLMVGPPGGLNGLTFANPTSAIGNPFANVFGFASSLVAPSERDMARGQSAQQGAFFLWAPPPATLNNPSDTRPLPKVEVEFLDPNGDQAQFAFCYAPECKCDKSPPKTHADHNAASFACSASWDHKKACPCGDDEKCERKAKEKKLIKMKITIEGVPYATLDYRPITLKGFRIGSSFQQLVLDEGSHILTFTVLFRPSKSGTYGPKSVDFLKYTNYYRDKNKIKSKQEWASVELSGQALKCKVVWNCANRGRGGRGGKKRAKLPKIIVRNGTGKTIKVTSYERKIHSAVPAGAKTEIAGATNENDDGTISFKEPLVKKANDWEAHIPLTLPTNAGVTYNGSANAPIPSTTTEDGQALVTRTITVKIPDDINVAEDQIGVVDGAGNFYGFDPNGVSVWHHDENGRLAGGTGRIRLPAGVKEIWGGVATRDAIKKIGKPKKVVDGDYSLKIEPEKDDWVGKDMTLTITMTELIRADYLSRPKDKKDKPLIYDIQVDNHEPHKLRFKSTEGLEKAKHADGKTKTDTTPALPGITTGTVTIDPKKYDPEKPSPRFVKIVWHRWTSGEDKVINVDVKLRKEEEK